MRSSRLLVFSLWIVVVLLLKTCHPRVQNPRSKMSHHDIRSGSYDDDDKSIQSSQQYPFIAILVDSKSKQPFCTGTLIEELIVLTAAQCIEMVDTFGTRRRRQLRSFFVGLACDNLSVKPGQCQKHRVDYAVIHDRHVSLRNLNDLAMLKLRKVSFESGRAQPKPKRLSFPSWNAVDLRDCRALGYGYPSKRDWARMLPEIQRRILARAPKGSQSSLRSVKVSMARSRGVCPRSLLFDRLKFICSDQQSEMAAMFFVADRGGPLLCPGNDNAVAQDQRQRSTSIVVGQFTWQAPMESLKQSSPPVAVFTNLSFHFEWINEIIPLLKALKDRDTLIKYIEYPPPNDQN